MEYICTVAETVVTTINITDVNVSILKLQLTLKLPELIQLSKLIFSTSLYSIILKRIIQEKIEERIIKIDVKFCEYLGSEFLRKKKEMIYPVKGKNKVNVANKFYPFISLIFSTEIEALFLKKDTNIANPIAASAAATVNVNIAKT